LQGFYATLTTTPHTTFRLSAVAAVRQDSEEDDLPDLSAPSDSDSDTNDDNDPEEEISEDIVDNLTWADYDHPSIDVPDAYGHQDSVPLKQNDHGNLFFSSYPTLCTTPSPPVLLFFVTTLHVHPVYTLGSRGTMPRLFRDANMSNTSSVVFPHRASLTHHACAPLFAHTGMPRGRQPCGHVPER
jgi:hypothetical protein